MITIRTMKGLLSGLFLLLGGVLRADTWYWDGNNDGVGITDAGIINGGSDIWEAGTAAANIHWCDATGSNNTNWAAIAGSDAILSGNAGTVTLNGSLTAGRISIRTAGYTIKSASSGDDSLTCTEFNDGGYANTILQGDNVRLTFTLNSGTNIAYKGLITGNNRVCWKGVTAFSRLLIGTSQITAAEFQADNTTACFTNGGLPATYITLVGGSGARRDTVETFGSVARTLTNFSGTTAPFPGSGYMNLGLHTSLAAVGGKLDLLFNGGGTLVCRETPGFGTTALAELTLGSSNADNVVELKNNIQIQTNLATTAASMTLVIRDNASTTTDYAIVSGIIANGPGGACGITKDASGTGLVALTATNTFTGAFNLNGGVLRARNGIGLPSASPLNVNGGLWESDQDMIRTNGSAAGQLRLLSGASGFSVHGGGTTRVCFGAFDNPTNLTWDSTDLKPATLVLNSIYADGTLEFVNALSLSTNSSASLTRTVLVAAATAVLSSNITQGAGGAITFEKTGAGTLVMKGNNTWQGGTVIREGILLVNNASGSGTGTGTVTVTSGATIGGTGTVNSLLVKTGAILAPGSSGVGRLTVAGPATLEADSILQADVTGGIADRLEVAGNLTLPATAFVPVTASVPLAAPVVLLSAGSLTGSVSGWTVTEGYTLRQSGNTILLAKTGGGSLVLIR